MPEGNKIPEFGPKALDNLFLDASMLFGNMSNKENKVNLTNLTGLLSNLTGNYQVKWQ